MSSLPMSSEATTKNSTSTSSTTEDASYERPSIWSGFYKKALRERQVQLKLSFPHLFAPNLPSSSLSSSSSTTFSVSSLNGTPTASPPSSPLLSSKEKDRDFASSSFNKSLNASCSVNGDDNSFPIRGLDERIADNMVENCIGTMGLPVGLALNFVIDGVPTVVPMAVEEPSVIAAVSGAAKTLSSGSEMGFITQTPERNIITAQLLVTGLLDHQLRDAIQRILEKKKNIIMFANQFCLNMYKRGGGVVDLLVRTIPKSNTKSKEKSLYDEFLESYGLEKELNASTSSVWFVIHIVIDVCDAMGANCASTVAEGASSLISDLIGARVAVRIVSNLNPNRVSKAMFKVPMSKLGYKKFTGPQVAARILEAYHWAKDDVYRATTHNKGIMNGIDAVAVATGQDWRAVEAACHSWASGSGKSFLDTYKDQLDGSNVNEVETLKPKSVFSKYTSLTKYWVEKSNQASDPWLFCGELELPIIVGTKGGVLSTSPLYSYTLGMMGFPDSKRLAAIMCCVGLCQNFAALRALTTEGIQRGHMHLHARNIAIAAGAPTHAISEVTQWMIQKGRIQLDAAKEYITAHHLFTNLRKKLHAPDTLTQQQQKPPSMFFFQESKDKPLTLNIAFQTLGEEPVYLDFTEKIQAHPVHAVLLGGKTYDWLMRTFPLIEAIKLPILNSSDQTRTNEFLCKRLKVLSLILNVLLRRLMIWCPEETREFVDKIFSHTKSTNKLRSTNRDSTHTTSQNHKFGPFGSHLSSSVTRSLLEKKPSIMKHIHNVIHQALKHRSSSSLSQTTPFVNELSDTATALNTQPRIPSPMSFSRSPSGTQSPSSPSSPPASPASPASPKSPSPSSLEPQPSLGDLAWMFDPQLVPNVDSVLPDSGIFRWDIFEDVLHLKDPPPKESMVEDEGLGASNPPASLTEALNSRTEKPSSSHTEKPLETMTTVQKVESTQYLNTVPTKRQILQVGFPLVLAIWQVFELWVTQYVGTSALASSLLDELRAIVSSLVATHSDIALDKANLLSYDVEPTSSLADEEMHALFLKSFHVQTKRAQCTLFLLIDLIGLDPNTITVPLLNSIKAAGFYLEQEATVAHDIARLSRDYRAVFGPDDPTAELVSIPVTRSPQSPQLQFRRRSLQLIQKQTDLQHPGDELIALHTVGICNSVLTYAILCTHLKRDGMLPATTKPLHHEMDQERLSLAEVSNNLRKYLDTLNLDSLRSKLGREINIVLSQTKHAGLIGLNQEYLSTMATLLRHEFKVIHLFRRKELAFKIL